MRDNVDRYYRFMMQYADFMEEMAKQEDVKYGALVSNDLPRMEKSIADQQAMLMKLENLERQRISLQEEIGWADKAFREILGELPEDEQDPYTKLFDRISRLLEHIKFGNEKAMSYAKMNLHINELMSRQGEAGAERQGSDGEEPSGPQFETKI